MNLMDMLPHGFSIIQNISAVNYWDIDTRGLLMQIDS